MTDEFMGRLNPATAQRIAPLTLGAVGNAVAMVTQVGDEVSDLSPGFEGRGLQPREEPRSKLRGIGSTKLTKTKQASGNVSRRDSIVVGIHRPGLRSATGRPRSAPDRPALHFSTPLPRCAPATRSLRLRSRCVRAYSRSYACPARRLACQFCPALTPLLHAENSPSTGLHRADLRPHESGGCASTFLFASLFRG